MKIIDKIITIFLLWNLIAISNSRATDMTYSPIQVNTKLSQNKLVQHGANTVFVDVTFTPPAHPIRHQLRRATDIIIVLDRSGSMSEAKKMPFAKAAIWDVLGRLNEQDRFALVTFADNAIVQSPLVNVNSATRSYLNNIVSSISPSGSTNISDGLNTAMRLLQNHQTNNAKKILLLSDGQANRGITNPQQLAQFATNATHYGAVVSSIGMGLGFNESLMATIADYGMGHYSYLEDLSGLSAILARDLEDTRNIYANSSYLNITLGDGVQLIDAGGYPLIQTDSSTLRISTGQILSNTPKHFVMTFTLPTENTGSISLAAMHLNYQFQDQLQQTPINSSALTITVLAPEFKQQAQESINKDVYKNSWVENNLGRMKKKLSLWMREGKKEQAKEEITQYRKALKTAAKTSNIPLASPKIEEKLDEMEQQVDEAFVGSMMDQQVKRNRAAKSMQYEAITTQRK